MRSLNVRRSMLGATAGPRYFGFVTGGSHAAALAADWLTSAWDQNAALYVMSPASSVVEETVASWLVDLFGLSDGTRKISTGFTRQCLGLPLGLVSRIENGENCVSRFCVYYGREHILCRWK